MVRQGVFVLRQGADLLGRPHHERRPIPTQERLGLDDLPGLLDGITVPGGRLQGDFFFALIHHAASRIGAEPTVLLWSFHTTQVA